MEAKMMIAGSFDEFVEKIAQAERKALNTPFGQEITERLLKMKLEENPDMTCRRLWQNLPSIHGTNCKQKKYNATGRHCCRPERMVNDYENRYCYLQQV